MRVVRAIFAILLVGGCWRALVAAEPAARELISPNSVVLVEINRPLDLLDSPLSRGIWELVKETNGVKQKLNSPEIDKFRQAARFVEKSLGVDWRTGINRLTAGGIVFAVAPQKAGSEPVVTAGVTAGGEEKAQHIILAAPRRNRRHPKPEGPVATGERAREHRGG